MRSNKQKINQYMSVWESSIKRHRLSGLVESSINSKIFMINARIHFLYTLSYYRAYSKFIIYNWMLNNKDISKFKDRQ